MTDTIRPSVVPEYEARLDQEQLLAQIRTVLDIAVSKNYPEKPGRSLEDPTVSHNVYDDGSHGFNFGHGLWRFERRFLGGGISDFEFIKCNGELCSDTTILTYRKKAVWTMHAFGALSAIELSGGKLIKILMMLARIAKGARDDRWQRTPAHHHERDQFISTCTQNGALGHFGGSERINIETSRGMYTGDFVGGMIE